MAPKRITVAKKKRQVKIGSSKTPYDDHKFQWLVHEEFSTKLKNHNMVQE